ncbi:lysostaphin resistance A-like protein [Alteribacillus sp. HJP-4]|uniref:CPBP family intramembrane glutamic endopeptidase n=1 Tax=Alteribacillus sp. HJP-4 TaxID=2775394 RepID=UPI0035CCF079
MEKQRSLPEEDVTLQAVWKSFGLFVLVGILIILMFYNEGRIEHLLDVWSIDNFVLFASTGLIIGGLFASFTIAVYKMTELQLPDNDYTRIIKDLLHKKFGIMTIAVGASVAEEVLFRAALLGVLALYIGEVPALFLVALIFMALHIPQYKGSLLIHFIVFFMGVVLGLLFLWTGTLWAPIIAHGVYNAIIAVLMKMGKLEKPAADGQEQPAQ